MKTSRFRPLVGAATLALAVGAVGATAGATGPYVTICKIEADSSWDMITVDYEWVLNGYQFQTGNIIPAFSFVIDGETVSFPGKNLDTVFPSGHTGQQILDNGCEVPAPPSPPTSTTTTTTTTTTTIPPTTTAPPSTAPPTTEPPAPGPPASTTTTTTTVPTPPTTEVAPPAPPVPPTTEAPPSPPTTEPPESSPPSGGAPPRQSEPPIDPPDGPDLPNTGAPLSGPLGAGLSLLFAGSVLQVMGQRRRTS